MQQNTGQTEWADGLVQQSGITTTFNPNTRVPYTVTGQEFDIDYVSWREGTTVAQPTYAAITSRSYHEGLVHILLMDGSARGLSENVSLTVWRALGTRAGSEVTGDF